MNIVYKDISKQIELLKSKNILIQDEERAKEILLRENYYNLITGYKDIFLDIKNANKNDMDRCVKDTYFEEIYCVYKFDRELRNIMLKYISIIEINIKSYISNIFSKKYGTYDYLEHKNFNITSKSKKDFQELINKINLNIERNIDNYEDIKKCREQYNTIPLWMLSTLMTFGNIIKFYTYMKIEDKKDISNILSINYQDLQIFLKMLNIIRNISAHNNILFNIRLDIKYPIRKTISYYHEKLGILKNKNIYESGINDILSIIIILKRLLQHDEYLSFVDEFIRNIDQVKNVLDIESFENFLKCMSIPINYDILSLL